MIDDNSAVSYGILFTSVNQPSYRLDQYSLSVSLSQTILKRVLDYTVTPHLDFRQAEDFSAIPGLIFTFNVTF